MGLGRLKPFCNASLCALFVVGSFLVAQNCAPRIDKNPTITVRPAVNQVEDTTPAHHLPAENYNAKTDLRIGSGDLLEIKVYGSTELSNTVRVSDAGEMTMPLIGAVEVSGLTAEEAQNRVEQRLLSGGFLRDPQVNILVKEFAHREFPYWEKLLNQECIPCLARGDCLMLYQSPVERPFVQETRSS